MKINAIKTEVQDATYVEAARWGKHRGWRYVLGLVVILFAGLVVLAGSAVTAPVLFTVSKFHATYTALSMLVVVSVFLAIAYGVFKRKTPTRFPEPRQDRG